MMYRVWCMSPWTKFELTTLVVIDTDCTCSCKSNYHTNTNTMAPYLMITFKFQILLRCITTMCSSILVSLGDIRSFCIYWYVYHRYLVPYRHYCPFLFYTCQDTGNTVNNKTIFSQFLKGSVCNLSVFPFTIFLAESLIIYILAH